MTDHSSAGGVYYTGDRATDLARLESILSTPGECGFDFETTISPAVDREICTIQATHEDGREGFAYVYPDGAAALRQVMRGARARLVAHNATFEMECFLRSGVHYPVDCTMVAAKSMFGTMEGDKSRRTLWSLAALSERLLGKPRDKTTRDRDWRLPPDDEALEYGMDDTRDALAIWKILLTHFERFPRREAGYRVIADAIPAIAACNLHGLPFDFAAHEELVRNLDAYDEAHRLMLDLLSCGEVGNHGSSKQVGAWLIHVLMPDSDGWTEEQREPWRFSIAYQEATGQHWPTTKGGDLSLAKGTVESRIESLTDINPDMAEYFLARLQWMKVAKLKQAFGKNLQQFIDPLSNFPYLRSTLKPHGAQTSRTSAQGPNIQQMPGEEEFRRLFKALHGRKLVVCDYGQIELRVGCIIADDKRMQEIFAAGVDIHQASATNIKRILTGVEDAEATTKERKQSKAPTFASLYGAMAPAIAAATGLPLADAGALLKAWLKTYPGIATYRDTALDRARKAGGIELVSGQVIGIAHDTRAAQAINAPVQGSAATVMYRAMTRVYAGVRKMQAAGADVWLSASVHDEIILDAADECAASAAAMLRKEMTAALLDHFPEAENLGLDNVADAVVVQSWGDKDLDDPEAIVARYLSPLPVSPA